MAAQRTVLGHKLDAALNGQNSGLGTRQVAAGDANYEIEDISDELCFNVAAYLTLTLQGLLTSLFSVPQASQAR